MRGNGLYSSARIWVTITIYLLCHDFLVGRLLEAKATIRTVLTLAFCAALRTDHRCPLLPDRRDCARALLQGKKQPLLLEARCGHFDEENEVCVISVRLEANVSLFSSPWEQFSP